MIAPGVLIGQRILKARFDKGWKQRHLAAALIKLGRYTTTQSITQWEGGQRKYFSPEDVAFLARALGKPRSYFTDAEPYSLDVEKAAFALPLVTAKDLVEKSVEDAIGAAVLAGRYQPTHFDIIGGFAMIAHDEAMAPTIKRGKTPVFLVRGMEPEQGDIILVKLGDDLFLRVFSIVGKRVLLASTNKALPVVNLSPRDMRDAELLGVACPVDAWLQRFKTKA